MKYFLTDDERIAKGGTCRFEFQSGRKRNKYKSMYWKNDSLYMDMNLLNETEWETFIPDFNYYGTMIITKGKWAYLQKHAGQASPAFQEMLSELTPWVERVFIQFNYFYIIGMQILLLTFSERGRLRVCVRCGESLSESQYGLNHQLCGLFLLLSFSFGNEFGDTKRPAVMGNSRAIT